MAPHSGRSSANRTKQPALNRIIPVIPLAYTQQRKQHGSIKGDIRETDAVILPVSQAEVDLGILKSELNPESAAKPADHAKATPVKPAALKSNRVSENDLEEDAEVSVGVDTIPELADESPQVLQSPPIAFSEQQISDAMSNSNSASPSIPATRANLGTASLQNSLPGATSQTHIPHPSVGSMVFGGYQDSNASPPTPLTETVAQTRVQNHPDQSRGDASIRDEGHLHTFSNGFMPLSHSGMLPYQPHNDSFSTHQPGSENFGRQTTPGFRVQDNYLPIVPQSEFENQRFALGFDPATPLSYHGSQSSAADMNGSQPYEHFAMATVHNGNSGSIDDVRLFHQSRRKARNDPHTLVPQQGSTLSQAVPFSIDAFEGLLGFIQAQFAEPRFADCLLELRYFDDRFAPVRIPGHNLLFARSPTLNNLLQVQLRDSSDDNLNLRTLLVLSTDRFLRSDGFSLAILRLYGGPLLDPGASTSFNMPISPAMPYLASDIPGVPEERFEIALGYAAAGHVLALPAVLVRGIEVASRFIGWATLEKALDFALDGGLDSQWTLEPSHGIRSLSTYGPPVNILITSALNFIINAFPPNFEFDLNVGEPPYNSRVPLILESRAAPANPRLSSIKFGDYHGEEVYQPTSSTSILSRILLNLPFPLLKYVLESSRLGNVQGWATAELRRKVMRSVIEEREKRRIRARESKSVSEAERYANRKDWDVVGWQESVQSIPGTTESLCIQRKWVNLVDRHDSVQ